MNRAAQLAAKRRIRIGDFVLFMVVSVSAIWISQATILGKVAHQGIAQKSRFHHGRGWLCREQ
jgi:hypothetical protein